MMRANCCTMTCAPISLGAGVRILADRLCLGAGSAPVADLHGRGYADSHLRLARHGITSLRESPYCCVGADAANIRSDRTLTSNKSAYNKILLQTNHNTQYGVQGGTMLSFERKKRGLSQKALAEKSGVPVRTIQNWEDKGVSHATVGNLLKVAEAMGCTLDEIVRGDYRGLE